MRNVQNESRIVEIWSQLPFRPFSLTPLDIHLHLALNIPRPMPERRGWMVRVEGSGLEGSGFETCPRKLPTLVSQVSLVTLVSPCSRVGNPWPGWGAKAWRSPTSWVYLYAKKQKKSPRPSAWATKTHVTERVKSYRHHFACATEIGRASKEQKL